jgi:DNA repair exonuclease SbcCD ATPase subunit
MSSQRLCAALAVALVLPVGAAGAERMTDEQVKKLIEDIATGYDTWKKDLEKSNLDDAVITSAERTINVKTFLKDFEKAIDTVKDRFKPEYAASPEVLALLRLGSDVELRHRRQGDTPRSTWPPLAAKLDALARAYGVAWPIESMNVQAGRLNDDELAGKVEQMEKAAKELRSEAENAAKANKAIDKASRESLKASIQQLEPMAKEVRSRIKDDRPAAVEVGQLFSQTAKVKDTLTKLSLFSAGGSWRGIDTGSEALARAFALPKP